MALSRYVITAPVIVPAGDAGDLYGWRARHGRRCGLRQHGHLGRVRGFPADLPPGRSSLIRLACSTPRSARATAVPAAAAERPGSDPARRFGSKVSPIQDHRRDPRDPDLAPPAVGSVYPGQVPVNAGAGAGQRAAPWGAPAQSTNEVEAAGPGWLGRPKGRGRREPNAGGGGACHRRGAGQRLAAVQPSRKVFRRGDRDAPGHVAGKTRAWDDRDAGYVRGTSVPSG